MKLSLVLPDRKYFISMESQRPDRWLWADKDSNGLLRIESRIPNPWVGQVIAIPSVNKTSGHGKARQRIPTQSKLIVFPGGGDPEAIPAVIYREIFSARFAYTEAESNLLKALFFPWEKKSNRSQVWLRYEFVEDKDEN